MSKKDGNHEIKQASYDLAASFERTNPSEQFRATLLLTFVGMQFSESQIAKAKTREERRRFTDSFNRSRNALAKGIRLLEDYGARSGKR